MANEIESGRPTADSQMKNESPNDEIFEDDVTEERYPTPQEREDVAQTETLDP